MPEPVSAIAKAIGEGLNLWKTFIATRQQAYVRKMDKRKTRAIEYAERYLLRCKTLGVGKDDKFLVRYASKFFKYNN